VISVHDDRRAGQRGELTGFRQEFYNCLIARADAWFELCDAVLCVDGPVTSLVELSLAAEHRRGHGALYDSLNRGRIDVGRFRNIVARQSIPRCAGGRIVLAIDVSNWLRPDAATSSERLFCHTYCRGKGQAQMIPGWPYSFVAALESGRTSWTAILDAQRLGPCDDGTAVAAAQLRAVVRSHRTTRPPGPASQTGKARHHPTFTPRPRRPSRGRCRSSGTGSSHSPVAPSP
jgi:hypothetical protein